jgi:hypothetical protein
MRFMVKPADGQTAIIDTEQKGRIVATCPHFDEALAIIAFLNGDIKGGQRVHAGFLATLKPPS